MHFDVQWVQTYAETKELLKQYGHDAGDLVLKNVANIMQGRFRASDIVARIGGEEFSCSRVIWEWKMYMGFLSS